ncbi:hypothetical protein LCGC14_0376910 [marine sediment metagenome]|uniref:Uncharacterized protein n=1 Tax=marine sediment metagenome TaxID=412755 RepID=A0A0F9T3K8_9ZZZZ
MANIFKEITRPFKQAAAEIKRIGKKIEQEDRRIRNQILGTVFPKPPKPDPLPIPDPPIVRGQPGTAASAAKRKLIKSGRGGTILTGQLAPVKTGKKRLLG